MVRFHLDCLQTHQPEPGNKSDHSKTDRDESESTAPYGSLANPHGTEIAQPAARTVSLEPIVMKEGNLTAGPGCSLGSWQVQGGSGAP